MTSMRSSSAFAAPVFLRGRFSTVSTSASCRQTPRSSIVLAPGQGAQYPGMGGSWKHRSAAAAKIFEQADAYLTSELGAPLTELISNEDAKRLSRTDIAQPAIFVTSMACWAGMKDLGLIDEPAVTAGLSLGEYTALTIAGAISFEDALKLVTLRGRAMQEAAEASDGGMVALIGVDDNTAEEVADQCRNDDILVAANFNAPGQVVLSGSSSAVDRAAEYATSKKIRVAKLDVAGAFHSPLMQPAAERLAAALEGTTIGLPDVPVLSNVSGEPHVVGDIRDMLVKQLTSSVRWASCCEYIRQNHQDSKWIELAPGKTLTGIMRKIDRKTRISNYDEAPVAAEA